MESKFASQAIVLMLFNDATILKYTDIREASGIEDVELRRVLQSLALGKTRVLSKEPKVSTFARALQCLLCILCTSTKHVAMAIIAYDLRSRLANESQVHNTMN